MNNYEWINFRRIWTAKVAKLLYIFILARNKTANQLQINLLNKYALSNGNYGQVALPLQKICWL